MANEKPKLIYLPGDIEFKKDLKIQAAEEGYNSPKDMIEQTTVRNLAEWKKKRV